MHEYTYEYLTYTLVSHLESKQLVAKEKEEEEKDIQW